VLRFAVVGALVAVAGAGAVSTERELGSARDLHGERYVTAQGCTRCHAEHAESFGRTFHRTMTQEARAQAVRAPFANEAPSYFGVSTRMESGEDGAKAMVFPAHTGLPARVPVGLTVGSRRVQQYIGEHDGERVRLPWAYHLEEQRWFHMNGAFLTPDPAADGPLSPDDFTRHVTRWNDNCIFCHNVRGVPGAAQHAGGRTAYTSTVEEYGVACEACHGPGAAHAALNASPYRRYRLHAGDAPDPSIVNPARLPKARALDVCGRCHGQRITDDVASFLRNGDPFVPGDDLALYSAPLWHDTQLAGEAGVFAPRFWGDGTPRLTAYEYQGVLSSRCASEGELTCLSCHAMHAGDPRGQLRPDRVGDALCTQCHGELAAEPARARHAQHTGAVGCVDCHMPPVVYGVLSAHPSHRIELPRPSADAQAARPDACTLCHLDQTRAWAVRERAAAWPAGARAEDRGGSYGDRRAEPLSEAERALLAGDPVTRTVYAARYADPRTFARVPTARALSVLLDVMEHDPYPGVRHAAWRSLAARLQIAPERAVAELGYAPEDTHAQRARSAAALRARLHVNPLDPSLSEPLRGESAALAIDIGE
jgi:predicted CXXCH cytochrome family protein